jgi:hypothetical protein
MKRTATIVMVTGRWYKILHRSEAEDFWRDYMSVMQYLGLSKRRGPITPRFNARPVAGVQSLRHRAIVSVEQVAATETPIVGYRWTEIQPARIRARRHHMKTAKRSGRRS